MATNFFNTDQLLVKGLKRGDHRSFKALFEKYSTPLFQFSLSYLKTENAAEDVVQDVFAKIWENRDSLKTNTSFKSYLFTIAMNAIRKQFGKLSKENIAKHDILIEFSANAESFNDKTNYEFLLNKLKELINVMPEKRKVVFEKRKVEGKSIKEIATELDVSPKTVERHITQAMNFLRDEFAKFKTDGLIFFHLFVKS